MKTELAVIFLVPLMTSFVNEFPVNEFLKPCYAIVPAAGRSRRMGKPKLLLPWPTASQPGGRLIDRVLQAWTESQVVETVVVIWAEDHALADACQAWPVRVIRTPHIPPDMKASVHIGLRYIQAHYNPPAEAGCFVAPADIPNLSSHIIDQLIEADSAPDEAIVPDFDGTQGHPVLLPWSLSDAIFGLPVDKGIDSIVCQTPKHLVAFPAELAVTDIDTPQEYQQALRQHPT